MNLGQKLGKTALDSHFYVIFSVLRFHLYLLTNINHIVLQILIQILNEYAFHQKHKIHPRSSYMVIQVTQLHLIAQTTASRSISYFLRVYFASHVTQNIQHCHFHELLVFDNLKQFLESINLWWSPSRTRNSLCFSIVQVILIKQRAPVLHMMSYVYTLWHRVINFFRK